MWPNTTTVKTPARTPSKLHTHARSLARLSSFTTPECINRNYVFANLGNGEKWRERNLLRHALVWGWTIPRSIKWQFKFYFKRTSRTFNIIIITIMMNEHWITCTTKLSCSNKLKLKGFADFRWMSIHSRSPPESYIIIIPPALSSLAVLQKESTREFLVHLMLNIFLISHSTRLGNTLNAFQPKQHVLSQMGKKFQQLIKSTAEYWWILFE